MHKTTHVEINTSTDSKFYTILILLSSACTYATFPLEDEVYSKLARGLETSDGRTVGLAPAANKTAVVLWFEKPQAV